MGVCSDLRACLTEIGSRHEGPECLSAHCICDARSKQVYLFGCDLGAVAGFPDRSVGALGDSSRDFSLKVAGNFSAFAMSSPQMLLQLSYMRVACSACSSNPEVYNLSNGIRLPFARSLGSIEHVLAGPPGKFSIDNIFASICLSNIRSSRVLFGDTEIADAQKWISQWIDLAEKRLISPMLPFVSRLRICFQVVVIGTLHCPTPCLGDRCVMGSGLHLLQ